MTPSAPEYRTIPLTQGQVTIVDEADYSTLSAHIWFADWCEHTQSFYAARKINGTTVRMHRVIMGLEVGDPLTVDHVDPAKTLDNRRYNLRNVGRGKQSMNRRRQGNNTSGFKGVSFHKNRGYYTASIRVDGKLIYLGKFAEATHGHMAYCAAATKHYGEMARYG